jgi:DNA-binding transcriptional MerR regulator
MNNKIELTKIEEIKKLLDDYNINVENIGNKVKLFIQENGPSFNKLKNFKIYNSNEISEDDESYIKQKLEEIKDKIENITEEIASSIYKPLSKYEDKINNYIKEYTKEDNSSIKDTKDMSLSDSFDGSLDFNLYFLNPNSSWNYQEDEKQMEKVIPKNIESIEKNNNNSGNMNFNSSSDKSSIPNTLFMCFNHKDKSAVYICNKHCQKTFCKECESDLGDKSEHGVLLKISERINRNSNSNISIGKDNFLTWINYVFKNLFKICNDLFNTNRIPNLPDYQTVQNINDLEEQKLFLDKIFVEHKKIQVLMKEDLMPNEQLLNILKSVTSSSKVILQSGEIKLNIYQILDESSKFFISIYPHRNINNHEQFSENISFVMKEKFPELNKNYIMNDNYVFLIANEYLTKKNYNKNIFISEEKNVKNSLYILNSMFSLKKNYLIESCQINANKLDKKYDAIYFKSEKNDIIEGEKYFPPIGWFGIGLKNDKDPKRPIAYLTFNKILNKEPLKLILNEIIEKKNLEILEYQSPKREFDKRHWNKVGKGIYLFPHIERAEKYTGTFDINNKKYKIVLLVKVEKDKIKEPKHNKLGCWVVEKDYVKICRILFKEINKD